MARASSGLRSALAVVALAVVQVLLPAGPWRPATEILLYLVGAAAVRSGMRSHRPAAVVAWHALGAALLAFAASSGVEIAELAGILPSLSSLLEAGLDVVGYGALTVAGLAVLLPRRGRRDREGWVDAATLLLAAGVTAAVWPDGAAGLRRSGGDLEIGLPLLTAVVLVAGVRLALPGSGRSPSGVALFGAGALALVGYAGKISASPAEAPRLVDALPLLAVAGVVVAARHPSMTHLGEPAGHDRTVSVNRLVGLGAALLVSPAVVLLWTVRHGADGYLLGSGIGLLTALALWRIGRLMTEREHTRAALAASEGRLLALLHHATDVIGIVDRTGRISYVSPAVEDLLGHPPQRWLGRRALGLVAAEDRRRMRDVLLAATPPAGPDRTGVDVRVRHADGSLRWVEVKVSPRLDDPGVSGWVVNVREISERKRLEETLQRQASTDSLTGLANRSHFLTRLTSATQGAGDRAAVLFLDLDDFKTVNDRWGHATGDDLLAAVAGRLRHSVRDADAVARLGGDEFAVLLVGADPDRTRQVADRMLAQLRSPLRLAGHTVRVTGSVGGALTRRGDAPADLVHRADTAMYAAKRHGKNGYEIID